MTQKSYTDQARQLTQGFLETLPASVKDGFLQAFDAYLHDAGTGGARTLGERAPDFRLPDARGGEIRLSRALEHGPVVLSFYRGGWCPYCNIELRGLRERLPRIHELGAQLIAVSPELPDAARETRARLELEFAVLSDVGNTVARDYGLLMQVPEAFRPLYLQWGIDIPAANGDDSYELPLPATYVIDGHGVIRHAFVDRDYTQRMEPDTIIEVLEALNP